ncbi:leucine carboxyl methyltransferase [Terfezia boudieri ATCC MYA-4762]|uniref:Leucine carboxyl methyltransferase 1 n=1 Tax=Terfezia boudieri ATCC MYA-4762 TaxID=1051890 RepID=A0A3N4M7I8_9PEZI|nr:leucine carboxyl methyltransferase [Terfezia boudieri ATCC MYA-4762]
MRSTTGTFRSVPDRFSSTPSVSSSCSRPGQLHSLSSSTPQDKDHIVQQTDVDASGSRLAAVNLGYLVDPYAALLHAGGENDRPRRFPLINRGTYTRTTAIDELVVQFLKGVPTGQRKQIVSLGAGSDTRYWRLKERSGEWTRGLVYHEMDFPEVARKKAERVKRCGVLLKALELGENITFGHGDGDSGGNGSTTPTPSSVSLQQTCASANTVDIDQNTGNITSPDYYLHAIDIRLLKPGLPASPLPDAIETSIPTLILSECCLIYLAPAEADAILTFFTTVFKLSHPLSIVLYEPIGSDDAFGKVMVQNLATRGIVLQTLKKYSTLSRQKERLRMLGFKGGQAAGDVDWIWENWVGANEKKRLARLEMLDEVEEWKLLARHYCVVWGWKNGEGENVGWEGWKTVAEQRVED